MSLANKIITSLAVFSVATVVAATPQYALVIDAGSTGSRIHLFKYQYDQNNQIAIKDIFTEKTQPGLSEYTDKPDLAGLSLKKLLDDANTQLKNLNVNTKEVPIHVLGTAGMRKLSEKNQQAIYANVLNYLTQHYVFEGAEVKTISGKMEGVYAWLDVNYQEGNFASDKNTLGIIDIGGASTQITFATEDTSKPDDEITLTFNNRIYTIFSKSFLGLGMNDARYSASKYPSATSCYPSAYFSNSSNSNQYDFRECYSVYSNVIDPYQISQQLAPINQMSFAVFSGAYYTYTFFGVEDASQEALEARMKYVCNMSWKDMQKEYEDSHVPDDILSAYCANGTYLNNLLYNHYHLSWNQIWVTNKTHNRQDIDWTLGVLLYGLISK